ncbi:MAG: HNH endonuclease, partial [Planctomycetaceae bacterium]|nr:HNH endonuclease [Planctomycetaceae bacterium]
DGANRRPRPPRAACSGRYYCDSTVKVCDTLRRIQPSATGQYSWSDWAQLIPADDELVIRTRSNRLRIPEVIVLTSYDRLPSNSVTFSRRNIFKRDRFTCQSI